MESSLASHRINTRSHPDPNPPPIVDNPERILWQTSKTGKLTADRSLPRTKAVPENLVVLEDSHFDLPHTKNIFRTRSHLDPNPPTIVDNPKRILWQTSKSGKLATDRNIPRTRSVPENLVVLEDLHFD